MRTRILPALLLLSFATPAAGQGVSQIMTSLRSGGGWVEIPIQHGRGSFRSVTVPTAMMQLRGCLNVWYGHSGTWEIEARENLYGGVLEVEAQPGVGVPFTHAFGMRAQVDIDVRWSEPRDTTLMMWVGLDLGGQTGDEACEPRYAGGAP